MLGVTTLLGLVDWFGFGVSDLFTGAQLLLGTGTVSPSRDSVVGDLAAPTLTGYTPLAVTWGAATYNPTTGNIEAVGTAVYQWDGPSDSTGQFVQSWGLNQPGAVGPPLIPQTLLAIGNLNAPVGLMSPTDALRLTIKVESDGTVSVTDAS